MYDIQKMKTECGNQSYNLIYLGPNTFKKGDTTLNAMFTKSRFQAAQSEDLNWSLEPKLEFFSYIPQNIFRSLE